jgi:transcriptional regulator with XRE-family HTH domain
VSVTFRNVDFDRSEPIDRWPGEAIETVIDRGSIGDWRTLAAAIRKSPWGPAARTAETVIGWGGHYGIDAALARVIAHAREDVARAGRERYAAQIAAWRASTGMSLREFASAAGTSGSRLSDYEHAKVAPSTDVLARLEHVAKTYVARPRVRRGAASLAELSSTIADDLAGGREDDAMRLVFGFADDFRGSSRPGRIALLAHEPPPTGDARFDALLAGVAEFFAGEAAIAPPAWVDRPGRFVEPWWFVASRPAFHAYTLAHTPARVARHGVFIAREVFDRA